MKWAHVDWCWIPGDGDAKAGRVVCERCGASLGLDLPAGVQATILRLQAFCCEHAKCRPDPEQTK